MLIWIQVIMEVSWMSKPFTLPKFYSKEWVAKRAGRVKLDEMIEELDSQLDITIEGYLTMTDSDLTSRLTTVLTELRDVMKRQDRIEELRDQITVIENENEDLEKQIQELINDFEDIMFQMKFYLATVLTGCLKFLTNQ